MSTIKVLTKTLAKEEESQGASAEEDDSEKNSVRGSGGVCAEALRAAREPIDESEIAARTDVYFRATKALVERGAGGVRDEEVVYAVFMRRPILAACGVAVAWLKRVAEVRGVEIEVVERYEEGDWVGAGEPLLWVRGRFSAIVDLETMLLQKLGPSCVAAHNAWRIARALPRSRMVAMDARHAAGREMAELMAYGAAVGSARARGEGAEGFVGTSTDEGAVAFGMDAGMGTMPHALVGAAGSTLGAVEAYGEVFAGRPLTALVDYFGREVTDALAVAAHFADEARSGALSVRLDTPGSRFVEGLDPGRSYAVLERHAPAALRRYLSEEEQRYLVGPGVSAAALWHVRTALDEAGFSAVKIVASSGFSAEKCEALALAEVPLDVVGTGSFLPERWSETYATADIVMYGGEERVKVGREFLLPSRNGGRGIEGIERGKKGKKG